MITREKAQALAALYNAEVYIESKIKNALRSAL